MSNLGSDNTPVKGENFTLPDGAQIDQDGGDLVVRDTDGTVALRRTDGAGWSLEGNDLNSVGTASVSALEAGGLVLGETYHFASFYEGQDPDARLDNAISAANVADTIYLENEEYVEDRSVDIRLRFVGTSAGFSGSTVSATWTLNSQVTINNIGEGGTEATFVINSGFCTISHSTFFSATDVSVNENNFRYIANRGSSVVFASDTENGIVDSCIGVSVTDNGNNTVGDIA